MAQIFDEATERRDPDDRVSKDSGDKYGVKESEGTWYVVVGIYTPTAPDGSMYAY